MYQSQAKTFGNISVDVWNDQFNLLDEPVISKKSLSNQGLTLAWLLQQNLPWIKILKFHGLTSIWVDFIIKFKDIFHYQNYLTNNKKLHYLQQHVTRETKRAIQGFENDRRGYILLFKKLKYIFGQKSRIYAPFKGSKRQKTTSIDDQGLLE